MIYFRLTYEFILDLIKFYISLKSSKKIIKMEKYKQVDEDLF